MSKQTETRNKVKILYLSGFKDPKLLKEKTKLSLPTIYDIIRRIESGEGIDRRRGSGRPRKLKCNDRKRIGNLANSHPKYSYARIAKLTKNNGSPEVLE